MSTDLLIGLSITEAVLLVLVLVVALGQVERRLRTASSSLAQLGSNLGDVEGQLGGLAPAVLNINAPLRSIAGALPRIAEMAETVARR